MAMPRMQQPRRKYSAEAAAGTPPATPRNVAEQEQQLRVEIQIVFEEPHVRGTREADEEAEDEDEGRE